MKLVDCLLVTGITRGSTHSDDRTGHSDRRKDNANNADINITNMGAYRMHCTES